MTIEIKIYKRTGKAFLMTRVAHPFTPEIVQEVEFPLEYGELTKGIKIQNGNDDSIVISIPNVLMLTEQTAKVVSEPAKTAPVVVKPPVTFKIFSNDNLRGSYLVAPKEVYSIASPSRKTIELLQIIEGMFVRFVAVNKANKETEVLVRTRTYRKDKEGKLCFASDVELAKVRNFNRPGWVVYMEVSRLVLTDVKARPYAGTIKSNLVTKMPMVINRDEVAHLINKARKENAKQRRDV